MHHPSLLAHTTKMLWSAVVLALVAQGLTATVTRVLTVTNPLPLDGPPMPHAPPPSAVLSVFSLSIRTQECDLDEEFARFGRVEKVTIVYDHWRTQQSDHSHGFGFIKMGHHHTHQYDETASLPPLHYLPTKLNIQFSTGEVTSETFFVTLLDSSCVLVLGHSWLTHYNPLIDWVLGHIEFQKSTLQMLAVLVPPPIKSTPASAPAASLSMDSPLTSDLPPSSAPYVSLIGAAAFACASKLPGATSFTLYIRAEDAKLRSAATSPPVDIPNMAGVPHCIPRLCQCLQQSQGHHARSTSQV
ncbi:hypothetical protein SCLCIDRAFT_19789 [Scleroderma citrinum Foug A]|uniref:RRM domain-containing protein n=1 Tax=Scleroderma citrinum Foug A TaxID=1036808 RepID=A0A0C3A655_9AGAM|nr:hypothetical protein SCLCIDRAFT_19789 [Scleroderma citrinum Foug A]